MGGRSLQNFVFYETFFEQIAALSTTKKRSDKMEFGNLYKFTPLL